MITHLASISQTHMVHSGKKKINNICYNHLQMYISSKHFVHINVYSRQDDQGIPSHFRTHNLHFYEGQGREGGGGIFGKEIIRI